MSALQSSSKAYTSRSGEKSSNAFRTISEVADDLGVQQHVLRFWETKFKQIKPMKRGGGRRYYRPEDMEVLRLIQHHLHNNGYTIRGVQKLFREKGLKTAMSEYHKGADTEVVPTAAVKLADTISADDVANDPALIKALLAELKSLRASLGD